MLKGRKTFLFKVKDRMLRLAPTTSKNNICRTLLGCGIYITYDCDTADPFPCDSRPPVLCGETRENSAVSRGISASYSSDGPCRPADLIKLEMPMESSDIGWGLWQTPIRGSPHRPLGICTKSTLSSDDHCTLRKQVWLAAGPW